MNGQKQTSVFRTVDQIVPAERFLQYAASLASALGALACGLTLGWSSSAGSDGANLASKYDIEISASEFSWIGSSTTLGIASVCIPIGVLADLIGRKSAMLLMVLPFIIGWLLIMYANSVAMFCIGRFITGISGGAFSITVPIYTAEIAESEIRGTLGTYFQLSLSIGVFLSYVLGTFVNMRILSIISATVPFIFLAAFVFMPETPIYYLKIGNEDAARKSLIKLRGVHYDVDTELQIKKEGLETLRENSISYSSLFKSRTTRKAFIISYGLMFFQQFSGINTIIFYTNDIFVKAGSDLKSNYCSIIVGALGPIAVFASSLVVDRLGRRILLLISIIFLFLESFILGIYFHLQEIRADVSEISWLPLVCVCTFMFLFNFGFGPLPWVMLGELFPPQVKGVAASGAGVLSWILAFVVTKLYSDLKVAMNVSGTFWLYSIFCFIGIFFVYYIVPETKGKSLEEIQDELEL